MTSTVTIRCENEDCWKWFEPVVLEPPPRATDADAPHPQHPIPTDCEAVCPHCGMRQAVPILDY